MDNYRTPPEIFNPLNNEFRFDLDAAADSSNALCDFYLDDALNCSDWPGRRIWLNPPYGRMLAPFVISAANEAAKGKLVVALIPMRTRADWFHSYVLGKAREVRAVRKRIKFLYPDGRRTKFTLSCDSSVIVWDGPGTGLTRMVSWSYDPEPVAQ